jgi:DNA sulfur modification protein DndD
MMRLVAAKIKNFKLLEDISLNFSTDLHRPLTVIRAENGSGKTSVLNALRWGFFGPAGLPEGAQKVRLTSSAAPVGTAVDIQVTIEFVCGDGDEEIAYTLIRTMTETPRGNDTPDRSAITLKLLKNTPQGHKAVDGDAHTFISAMLPPRLHSVFFTDGDDVQGFISDFDTAGRQKQVRESIQALLGLEKMRIASGDLESVVAKFRRESAQTAGPDLVKLEAKLNDLSEQVERAKHALSEAHARRQRITADLAGAQKELAALHSIGDIDAIHHAIKTLENRREILERTEKSLLSEMRNHLSSQSVSWALAKPRLLAGFGVLNALATRGVIPGASLGVLKDRLEMNLCICNADLSAGLNARTIVEALLKEQSAVSGNRIRQTETFHLARTGYQEYLSNCDKELDFIPLRKRCLKAFVDTREQIRQTGADLAVQEDNRSRIDNETVRQLTDRLSNAQSKLNLECTAIGKYEQTLVGLQDSYSLAKDAYDAAERKSDVQRNHQVKRDVAEDLSDLIKRTLVVLEVDHVHRVSERMNKMFMTIVGADPNLDGGVFQSATLSDKFDIVVKGPGGKELHPDHEVNGASKRALTLAFIWALMEVSGQVAPRIIDTPLGMTSGGVKFRMVDAITCPPEATQPAYQVILFLTRSEIAGIEDLIVERAGISQTLSCNKDYPKDLVHDWKDDHPLVRLCPCTVRQICNVCERRHDAEHDLLQRTS